MIELLDSREAHLKALSLIFEEKITQVDISSFGIWAGTYSNAEGLGPFFEKLNKSKIENRLLIGVSKFSSKSNTEDPCSFCASNYRNQLQRLLDYRKQWRKLNWAYHPENHSKVVMAYTSKGLSWVIMGGHNLTFSEFKDSSLKIPASALEPKLIEGMKMQFNTIWDESHPDLSEIKTKFELGVITAKPPCTIKEPPSEAELIEFLHALARKKYLEKSRFRTLAGICSPYIDQKTACLRDIDNPSPAVLAALAQLRNYLQMMNPSV